MNKIFYIVFAAQTLLLSTSAAVGVVAAQNESGGLPTTQAVGNLTNATTNPEDIKQMEVIGGTVNGTLNASESTGMGNTSSAGMNASSNMTSSSNMTGS
jgi:hypothetical protein